METVFLIAIVAIIGWWTFRHGLHIGTTIVDEKHVDSTIEHTISSLAKRGYIKFKYDANGVMVIHKLTEDIEEDNNGETPVKAQKN